MTCIDCGKPRRRGSSKRCLKCYRIAMSERNRIEAPTRMRKNNPMWMPGIKDKAIKTLKEIGHSPKIRGGNGKPISLPQKMLADHLGWPTEVSICTNTYRGSGLSTNYKLDIANVDLKIGIEVDGGSHCSLKRQLQDDKKQEWFKKQGWIILRFKNEDVLSDILKCFRIIKDYLYGITPISK